MQDAAILLFAIHHVRLITDFRQFLLVNKLQLSPFWLHANSLISWVMCLHICYHAAISTNLN